MAYDPFATAGLAPQDLSALFAPHLGYAGANGGVAPTGAGVTVGPQDGFTVLAVTQTQMSDAAGNLVDAIDVSFRVGVHPGVFTYSAPADFYSWSSPLAGVAARAQVIEALYALESGAPPSSPTSAPTSPLPIPWVIPPAGPSPTPSPEPPPRIFTPL